MVILSVIMSLKVKTLSQNPVLGLIINLAGQLYRAGLCGSDANVEIAPHPADLLLIVCQT